MEGQKGREQKDWLRGGEVIGRTEGYGAMGLAVCGLGNGRAEGQEAIGLAVWGLGSAKGHILGCLG